MRCLCQRSLRVQSAVDQLTQGRAASYADFPPEALTLGAPMIEAQETPQVIDILGKQGDKASGQRRNTTLAREHCLIHHFPFLQVPSRSCGSCLLAIRSYRSIAHVPLQELPASPAAWRNEGNKNLVTNVRDLVQD